MSEPLNASLEQWALTDYGRRCLEQRGTICRCPLEGKEESP